MKNLGTLGSESKCLTTKALIIGADKLSPDLAEAIPHIPEALYFVSYASNSHDSHKRRTYLGQEGLTIACYCCTMATLQVPSTRKPSEPAGPMPGLVKYTMPSNWSSHETLVGYPGDKVAENDGVNEILEVVSLLEEADIPCCITDVVALQYYGARRVRSSDWRICVPSILLSKAEELIQRNSAKYIPFRPDVRWNPAKDICKLPRFKCTGFKLFFLLVPSETICFSFDEKDAIVRGNTGLPFPGLRAFVQSLVDSPDLVGLEDVVDGMNLSEEWADDSGLRLKDETTKEGARTQRGWWHFLTTTKQKRVSKKYDPKYYATRYRLLKERYDPTINSWL